MAGGNKNQTLGCIVLLIVVAVVVGLCSANNQEIEQQREAEKAQQREEAEKQRIEWEAEARRAEQEARKAAGIPEPDPPKQKRDNDRERDHFNIPFVPGD